MVAALSEGLCVVRPDGEIGYVAPPAAPKGTPGALFTNVCWGGEDLTTAIITDAGRGELLACDWPRAGLRLHYNA